MGGATDPVDVYETNFSTVNQRNIFRQAAQKRLDISIRKQFKVTERIHLLYGFNLFNLTNTTSMDVPQNNVQIGQGGACGNAYLTGGASVNEDCTSGYEKYGMVVTSQADQAITSSGPAGGGTAGTNLFQIPYTAGTSGKNTTVPITNPNPTVNGGGATICSASNVIPGTTNCANNGATFGSVTTMIGSNRIITMDLHIVF